MKNRSFRMLVALLMLPAFFVLAGNTTETVSQVSGDVTLSADVDYVITSANPFADGAVLDITNTERAVVILPNVKPSAAAGHLNHIRINGVKAVKNTNCMIKIYANGSIILPHGKEISPLTVYTGKGQTGESEKFAVGSRQSLENHALNNRIQSFTLKRGYMVWFATKSASNNPGYNRIFIADKEDLKVDLPNILSSSVSALRVSQWNDASKKGYAGWDPAYNEPLNTTWCYSWDAGVNIWDDREYVTHHHHEGWPGISEVGNNGTSPNILGNNEPDNTGDDREQVNSVAEVLATWPEMMATGRRLGSPAVAGNYAWLYEFMDSIDARGWRCDFVAVHAYWYSDWGSWNSQLSGIRNRTGRPIWITEMNYGANWTGWPGSDRTGSAANYAIQMQHMKPIIDGLEATPWIERYAYYNWVEDCRKVIDGNMKLTPIGEYYANKESGMAYSSVYNVVPKLPKMKDPSDLSVRYDKNSRTATLTWRDYNGEYNGGITIERRMPGEAWQMVDDVPLQENAAWYTYQDKNSLNGYEYRVCVEDAAGTKRYTRVQEAVIEQLEAGDAIQINGQMYYAGGNLMVNGDFDLGTATWTDGEGNALVPENFVVMSAGGVDGGPFLQAWSSETSMNKAGALKNMVEIEPNQEYYFSAAVLNSDFAFHRLSLTKDGTAEDSVVTSVSVSPQWASQTATFNSGSYTRAMFSCRRLGGKSRIDKVVLCPIFEDKDKAIAAGVVTARKRAEWILPLVQKYADIHAELSAVLSSVTGQDEASFDYLNTTVEGALKARRAILSLDSIAPYVRAAIALELEGYEELQNSFEKALNATTITAHIEGYEAVRKTLDGYLPMIYATEYIQSANFPHSAVGWETKCGTYTEGDQRMNTVAGKPCWNAWWSGISAAEGTAVSMEIRQQLSDISHGVYALECKAATEHHCLSDQHAYMVIGGDTLVSPNLSYDRLDISTVADSSKWEMLVTPPVYVTDRQDVTIGFRGSKQGAMDYAWREYVPNSTTSDMREGWWCATDFTLRFYPLYRIATPEGGWGTICLPRDFTPMEGVKIYQIAGLNADYTQLCLTEIEEPLAGVPYIYHTVEKEVTFYETGEAVTSASTVNDLRGNFLTVTKVPATCYYLQNGQWHRATTTDRPQMENFSAIIRRTTGLPVLDSWSGATMPINGAVEEKAQGLSPIFVDGQLASAPDGIYTVDGCRVETPVIGEIYIQVQDGKASKTVYKE